MLYCMAINYGKGFITPSDREKGEIEGHPGDVWVMDNNMGYWTAKVGGTRKTKSEAQTIVTNTINAAKTAWDDDNVEGESADQKIHRLGAKPTDITIA